MREHSAESGEILQVLRRLGIRADKKLGQNFLLDQTILQNIVAAAQPQPDDCILEIGPGLGGLSRCLARSGCKKVLAVELDRRFAPLLSALECEYASFEVIYQDILKADLEKITSGQSFKVVANLPYYITTPVLMRFLESGLAWERLVVMVQNEVAGRMVSPPGGRTYGALSVAVQYRADARIVLTAPPAAFIPPPAVDSAVVLCQKRPAALNVHNEALFFQIVRAAFSQRRKIIANSLRNMGLTPEQTAAWLKAAEIDGQRRAETLSLEDFARLENAFGKWR
ncbi:MAG: 16S rRNA (adenine(1518)-N(6)/adenine(1519)-N(6))-dimethyltransferase RsmA [Acidaminococcales bacterium]|jgi:16S rRNA (adenine1518-N6/adenine1519-N6)-dimethyltransferase|nr:16S rRNA (adenine(1518)-N(6)/adenine(1519)-N(6))-dimethyltransferase RsmA [Acidaminococcales bacterium]